MAHSEKVRLYGVPHSLYTGRARSYLIKAGIDYEEKAPSSEYFLKTVIPKAGGRNGLPTLELPSGQVIRDGAAIIDHFESEHGAPFAPRSPKQNLISLLFDVIGAEGLLRPAMHYRWSFDAENLDYLVHHFKMITGSGEEGAKRARKVMDVMRLRAGPSFGVSPANADVIEAVYADQLAALEAHFSQSGYLLGGRPCIGDFGMIAPLFAHLGRDPKPLSIMLSEAPSVFRWVERMNRYAADILEFEGVEDSWLADDAIPDTLIGVLTAMAEDFVPETLAAADCINNWLADQSDLKPGTECQRGVGMCRFELRGTEIDALAQPYRFYLLARVQSAYTSLAADDKSAIDTMFDQAGLTPILGATLSRDIGRKDNLEVWL